MKPCHYRLDLGGLTRCGKATDGKVGITLYAGRGRHWQEFFHPLCEEHARELEGVGFKITTVAGGTIEVPSDSG